MTAPPATTRPLPWLRPALVVLLAVPAVLASTDVGVAGARVVALLPFLLLGPGLALVGWLEVRDPWRETALALGVSLAVDLLVTAAMAYWGARSSAYTLALLVGVALLGAAAQAVRAVARQGRSPVR